MVYCNSFARMPDFFVAPTRDLSVAGSWDMFIGGPAAYGDMGGANMFGGLDTHAAAIGRLNDDPYGDIVLGVHLADGGASQSGRVYLIFGGPFPGGFTWNLALTSQYDVRIDGQGSGDEFGDWVLTGDITSDGYVMKTKSAVKNVVELPLNATAVMAANSTQSIGSGSSGTPLLRRIWPLSLLFGQKQKAHKTSYTGFAVVPRLRGTRVTSESPVSDRTDEVIGQIKERLAKRSRNIL